MKNPMESKPVFPLLMSMAASGINNSFLNFF